MQTSPWQRRDRPPRIERRIEFAGYSETRAFLDALAQLSEEMGIYPDISFGRTYVNLTIHLDAPQPQDPAEREQRIDRFLAEVDRALDAQGGR